MARQPVIHHVFRAVVVAKLSYTSQAWSGFTSAADLQHINALLRRCIRQGFCSPDLTDITVIFDAADETLFRKILSDGKHLLAAPLLPSKVCTAYHLRPRCHDRQLIPKVNKMCDSTFIQRMLYRLVLIFFYIMCYFYALSCVLSSHNNEYCIVLTKMYALPTIYRTATRCCCAAIVGCKLQQ